MSNFYTFFGLITIIFGWGLFPQYPEQVRKILYICVNAIAGILILATLIKYGNQLPYGQLFFILLAITVGFWLSDFKPKHARVAMARRRVLPFWFDYLLFVDCFVILFGLPLVF